MAKPNMPQARHGFKTCKKCLEEKPLDAFDSEPRVKSGLTARCKKCLREGHDAWAAANPNRVKASREKWAAKYPKRVVAARAFTNRRIALERRESRLSKGLRVEPVVTEEGQRCPKCRRRKSVDEFCSNGWCKLCGAAAARKRLQSLNPERREKRRLWFRKYDTEKLYGVPFDELQSMLVDQGGVCKICEYSIDLLARRSGCVDHDHSTSRIRGILCVKCNAGLGQFRDNPKFLAAAISYLTEEE